MKKVKLYNIVFPIWLLIIFPATWIVVLPANFVIDLFVVVLTMKCLRIAEVKKNAKAVILKVWVMGFAADIVGTIAMMIWNFVDINVSVEFANAVTYNPLRNVYAFFWVTLCVLLSAILIYIFNYKWCLKNADFSNVQRKRVALALAVFTAPYLFYLPTSWFDF